MSEYKKNFHHAFSSLPELGGVALVEAGHIYADKIPEQEQSIGLAIGSAAVEALQELGITAKTMLFIDDYNAHGDVDVSIACYESMYVQEGFSPLYIVSERSLVPDAGKLLEELDRMGKVIHKKKGLYFPNGSAGLIRLVSYSETGISRTFSCELLDATLYIKKAALADGGPLVTVLPAFYKEQQNKTKRIVRAARCMAPILNVYFDIHGKIEVDFDY